MINLEAMPPVIVALDGRTAERSKFVLGLLVENFSAEQIMVKLPEGMARAWRGMAQTAQSRGISVIYDTRFNDSSSKTADNIYSAFSDEPPMAVYPDAFTVRPPSDTTGAEGYGSLKKEIADVSSDAHRSGGIAVFGYAQPEEFHLNDLDHMGDEARKKYIRAKELGFHALEVIYPALEYFNGSAGGNLSPATKLITSKLSLMKELRSDFVLEAEVRKAYEQYGAAAIQLGSSVAGKDILNPEETVTRVLDVYHSRQFA